MGRVLVVWETVGAVIPALLIAERCTCPNDGPVGPLPNSQGECRGSLEVPRRGGRAVLSRTRNSCPLPRRLGVGRGESEGNETPAQARGNASDPQPPARGRGDSLCSWVVVSVLMRYLPSRHHLPPGGTRQNRNLVMGIVPEGRVRNHRIGTLELDGDRGDIGIDERRGTVGAGERLAVRELQPGSLQPLCVRRRMCRTRTTSQVPRRRTCNRQGRRGSPATR